MTFKYNFLGVKLSLSGYHFPVWLMILAGVALGIANVSIIAAIVFWCIETLFKFHIEYTFETVLAVAGLKFFLFDMND